MTDRAQRLHANVASHLTHRLRDRIDRHDGEPVGQKSEHSHMRRPVAGRK